MIAPLTLMLALSASPATVASGGELSPSEGWRLLLEGRNSAAQEAFIARLDGERADPDAAIGLAAITEARGDRAAALAFLQMVPGDAEDARLVPGAWSRAASLTYRAHDGAAAALPFLASIAGAERPAAPEVRSLVSLAYADALARLGEFERAMEHSTEKAGRLDTWTLIGPFGRFSPLDLARPFPPEEGILDTEDLEAGRSRLEPFRLDTIFPQGRVLVPLQFRATGIVYAISDVIADRDLRVRARVSSNSSYVLFVDGREALRVDRDLEHPALAQEMELELPEGRHRLAVKLANSGRHVSLDVILEDPARGLAPEGLRNVPVAGDFVGTGRARVTPNSIDLRATSASVEDPAGLLASAWWLRGRDLDREAGLLLEAALSRWPSSSLLTYLMGEHLKNAATGASATEDLARARGLLEKALSEDPSLVRARLLLAEMDEAAGQLDEAWKRTIEALESRPGNPDALVLRARLALREGWFQEARRFIEEARASAPGRLDLLDMEIQLYRSTNALVELEEALEKKGRLAPGSEDWAEHLSAAGRSEEALAAWQAMIDVRPSYLYGWLGLSRLLTDLGRYGDALATLDQAQGMFPYEAWIPYRRAGLLALRGDDEGAEKSLEKALELDPSRIEIRATLEERRGRRVADPWLVDVPELIAAASRPAAGVDSALLADTAVVVIDRFGGQSEVYQGVHAVYTREGVDQEGELQLQPGARIERIRIHKADGRRVDVALPPRPPISLPGLEPGDFIEYVWRRYIPPMNIIPGALDNRSLFLFQGPEREYDFSRYVVIHDDALAVEVCGRDDGLETSDEREGNLRIRSWTGRSMPQLALEPHIPSQLEIIPHIRLGMGIAWSDVGDLVRAAMKGNLHRDEPLPTLAGRVRAEAGSSKDLDLARALHLVVGREIGVGASALRLGTPASVSASLGEGNRALIALALARELGLEASLVLARPIELSGRELGCPTPGLFSYALVEVDTESGPVYLDFNDLNHPFDSMNARFSGSDALRVPLRAERDPEIFELPRRDPELLERVDAAVSLSPEGLVSGRLSLTSGGTLAAALRKAFREMPIDNQPLAYRSLASRIFPGAEVVDSFIRGVDEESGPIVIDLVFQGGQLGRRTPTGVALPVVAGPLPLASEYGQRERRAYPMLLDLREKRIDRFEIDLPQGLGLAFEARDLSLSGPFGDYALEVSAEEQRLVIERRADIPPRRIEPDEYPAFREFSRAIEEVEKQELLLRVESPSLR